MAFQQSLNSKAIMKQNILDNINKKNIYNTKILNCFCGQQLLWLMNYVELQNINPQPVLTRHFIKIILSWESTFTT